MTTATPLVELVPLSRLHESPTNRRTHWNLDELVASVKAKGILSPLLARPNQDGYELVFGHRRLRAAKKAGLAEVPVMIRKLDDKEALEAQVVENCQREDVHPLEEAEGYEILHKTHGYTVEQLGAKVGKSKAYVYARLKLLALAKPGREAFYAGKVDASTALLIARIPAAELQAQALKEISDDGYQPMSYREAAEHIQRTYMLRLDVAPFDRGDATLVPAAGACKDCPKRTGNQRELFADVKSSDVCTDPKCFDEKRTAAWARQSADASKRGQPVLEPKKGSKLFRNGRLDYGSAFVDLGEKNYDDPKARTWKKLLGKACPPVTLAQDDRGNAHEIVEAKAAREALKSAGHKWAKERAPASMSDGEKKRRAAAEFKNRVTTKAVGELVAAVEAKETPPALFDVLAKKVAKTAHYDVAKATVERRGLGDPKGKLSAGDLLVKATGAMKPRVLFALIIELLVTEGAYSSWSAGGDAALRSACKLYKVDVEKIAVSVKAQDAAKRAAKRVEKKGKAK